MKFGDSTRDADFWGDHIYIGPDRPEINSYTQKQIQPDPTWVLETRA